jgi:Zn finger protein HypA/HybF involved in hydrogenase expression
MNKKKKKKKVVCLTCGNPFPSKTKYFRTCPNCLEKNSKINGDTHILHS